VVLMVLFIDEMENIINGLDLEELRRSKRRKATAFYINVETDLTKLKNELEEIQKVNINNYSGRHKTFFNMQLEYMEECHHRYKNSDFIINNGVAVPMSDEYEQTSKEIIKKLKEIINEFDLKEQEDREKRKRKSTKKK